MRKMPSFLSVIQSKIPRHFSQVLATLAVSLGPFAAGLGKGYSSPALASLQESKSSTFHVSAQEGSWVASLSLLGALFGCLFGGLMLQIGRKRSLLIIALPFSGSWLLTVFAQRVEMMYSTSFIGGFFSAVTLLATQVYVSEIAHPEIRGCLSAVLKMAGEIGTLSSFTLGAFLDWRQLATVAAMAPILFFFAILLIPETPSFLLYHGREEEATRSLAWLRSTDQDVSEEIATLRSNILTKYKSFFPRCGNGQFPFRSLFICCGLMFFQKFSGVTVFHHYAVPIFKQVFGRSLHPHGAAIVVVLLRLLGSMTSGLLIDTAGRLPLLILSNLFISGSFFGFGLYNWMEESLPPNYPGFGPSLDWIPLTCVLFFTLFFSIGIGPISWLMVGELFPLEYRGFGGAVSTSFSYACAFAAVKTYVDIKASVGLYGAFWIYSAISVAGLFFVCCLVPETKGVELEEMEHHQTPAPAPVVVPTSAVVSAVVSKKHVKNIMKKSEISNYQRYRRNYDEIPMSSYQSNHQIGFQCNKFYDDNFCMENDDDFELEAVVRDPLEFYQEKKQSYYYGRDKWVTKFNFNCDQISMV
ncbi:facilitated trehalose transporter Tret1-like [Folsomia candida]|uniref:facilitated trehalose transporter Tret1-like n=1 Tax=Folsomia candida TaxID=158441 RepID=UPI000B8EF4BE|nr:facilitated trehalose transporter Tret1-like [Folsomia candida]XP_035706114.1 facilitated trehalose transporter Tret1-like [Folsomia candida]